MPKDLIIESISIEGLRGFNRAQPVRFDGAHALIAGRMGTGKSSTLCAIEWAMFGDIAHIKCSESRTQAEFVNANKVDQKAKVILKLKGDDGEYIIQREKHAKKKDFNLTLSTPYGEFEADDAANQIYSLFGTFEDFHRSVFLHQEAVRTILTENPEERDAALDRLFGLERTRQLMSAIPVPLVRKEYEKLNNDKTRIEERIKGATQQAEVEMKRAREEALEMGLKKEDFSLSGCGEKFKKITKNISVASENCGIQKPSFLEPTSEGNISKGLKKVKEILKNCRLQITATSKFNELQRDLKQINGLKEELEKTLRELTEAQEEYKKMEEEWGTTEKMEKQENEIKLNDEKLGREREAMDSIYRLIADGVEVLSKQDLTYCPICDTKISSKDVLSRLETKVSIALKERLSQIDNGRKENREALLKLETNKKAMAKAISHVEETEKAKNTTENAVGDMLQLKSKDSKFLLTKIKERLLELQIELEKTEKALAEKNEILQAIEDSADTCKAIARVLEKEAEYDRIKETFAEEGSQIEILKTQIAEMSALHARLQGISDAIANTQINLAKEFVGKGQDKISDYYARLCGHPYYNSIRIDIDQRNVKGIQKNTYNIKAFNNKEGRETLVSTRFSTGQMNCAALSIFLALSSMLDKKPKFVILDDPSQNLDTEHKKSLVKILGDVALENQVIIATQDAELAEEIEGGFMPKGGYHLLKYEEWDKEGPKIKVSNK